MTCKRCGAPEVAKQGRFAGKLCFKCCMTFNLRWRNEMAARTGSVRTPWDYRERR